MTRELLKIAVVALALLGARAGFTPAHAADAPATAVPATAAPASETVNADVRQIWKLLDYIAVDYTGAVKDGVVISDAEFAEMKEFSNTALARLAQLPVRDGQAPLVASATQLQGAIIAMTPPASVADMAHDLADALLVAYPVPMAPASAPNVARGAQIYADRCAACHGVTGAGDGETGKHLDPPPIAFTDHERARERSLFSLYEVVSQGLADTAMASFDPELLAEERWDVAFYAATLSATPEIRTAGEALWKSDAAVRGRFPNLESLVRTIESGLAADIGADKARPVLAYLRFNPGVVGQNSGSDGLALARSQLTASVKAYQEGDPRRASTLALSSYLDGFEPSEAMLSARDASLLGRVETAMIEYRSSISAAMPPSALEAQAKAINAMFDDAEAVMSAEQDATATFLGAFTILLREGVEALLVVIAMIGFLRKVERYDVLPYVHMGWIGALVAGLATWAVAAYAFDISGANRELTEGFSALFAAVILLAVGIWMHQKSLAGRWQIYIREKLSAALTKRSAFFLFLLAFVAVYREVFETILFYIALWTRGNGGAILAGLVAGAAALAVIAAIMLRTSRRLPIGQFFGWSSLLIAVLAVVLAGKGVAALQEAGMVPAMAVDGPRIELLGVYPSLLPLVAQAIVLVVAVAGYLWNTRGTAASAAS